MKQSLIREQQEKLILDLLKENGNISCSEIKEKLGISTSTVRLRLKNLESEGFLTRTHGGAVYRQNDTQSFTNQNQITNYEIKAAIARQAISTLHDGEVITMGTGTTTQILARELCNCKSPAPLIVITNSLYVAMELLNRSNTEIRVCGGVIEQSMGACCGEWADFVLNGIRASKTFLGVDSITLDYEFTQRYVGAISDEPLLRHRGELYVLADHTKFENTPYLERICSFADVNAVITDDQGDPEKLRMMREKGLKIITSPTEI